eukprot:m.24424 g.24424  ORF g.24424 m.24424 type:complete len:342 (+) comp14600_c0_seq1:55-1080(+)
MVSQSSLIIIASICCAASADDYGQFGPVWQRIANCGIIGESPVDIPRAQLADLAETATQVRFCEAGSTVDCVTSKPGSWPIVNLRNNKFLLSHKDLGQTPCDKTCVGETWDGPAQRLKNMFNTCGDIDHASQSTNWWYWACGNAGGIHYTVEGRICGWSTQERSSIEIFINSGSFAPTSVPTSRPTQWFEAGGHKENITTLQSNVETLQRSFNKLEAHVGTTIEGPTTIEQMIIDLTVKLDNVAGLLSGITANVTVLETDSTATKSDLAGLRNALKAAVATAGVPPACQGAECIPQISTNANDIVLQAGGLIKLQSSSCDAVDLCDATSFSARLKQALRNL